MDKSIFWNIIDDSRNESKSINGNKESLNRRLSCLELDALIKWDNILDFYYRLLYKNKLYLASYILYGGSNKTIFNSFIGWIISQGEQVVLDALKNPDSLVGLGSLNNYVGFEEIFIIVENIYYQKCRLT